MTLALTNKTVNKYFRFLSRLDNGSKKTLIMMLTESIETKSENKTNIR